ncbi:MAG: autotransporter-associated beta strand repeat-containing protein [Akkermansiaceae bacterium]
MKTQNPFNSGSIRLASTLLLLPLGALAQTVEIDPAGPIPGTHTEVFSSDWNTDGDTESWTTNGFTLESGAPISGILTGVADNGDPQLIRTGLSVASSSDTIIEFRIKKESSDDSRIDLFWADDNPGISGARLVAINNPPYIAADDFHVVRITFSGQITGNLTGFRFDVTADEPGTGKNVSVDYFRVYSASPPSTFAWDPGMTGTGTSGGSGNWNTSSNFWWDGSSQTSWPSLSSGQNEASFAGTAGTVTIDPTGVTASALNFNSGGYRLNGGPLTLDGNAILRSPAGLTTINAPLDGIDPITFNSGSFIINQPGLQTNSTRLNNIATGTSVDDAFGTGTVILGNGGNVFLSALGSPRSFNNDFEWRGNRFILDGNDFGTGTFAFPLVIGGNLLLAGTSPSDFVLRRSLTVNGQVSGSGPDGRSLYFALDANTMTLNSDANTFTGTITWDVGTTLEVVADGSMGDSSNGLSFNADNGTVKLLNAFDSARAISVVGDTGFNIDTNGFDSIWSGGINGQDGINTRFSKTGSGVLTLGGANFLGGGTKVQAGTLELPAGASLTHGNTWDNSHGVAGGATFHLNGGSMLVDSSFYAVGNSVNPASEALFLISGGDYTHNGGAILLGFGGNARFIMNAGTATINQLAYGDGDLERTAIAELNGGTLSLARADRRGGDATATIKLNGTILTATADETDFLRVGAEGTTEFLVGSGGAKFNTDGFSIAIMSDLDHDSSLGGADGGLEKFSAGTLTLSGNNTYTGDTVVNGGVLAVNGNSIPNTGKLVINAATVDATGVETVATLFFGTTQKAAGTWGSTASTATNKDDTHFSGAGVINVTSGVAGYAAWIAGFTVADPTPDGDPDYDGSSNLLEYVLNGNPATSDLSILPTVDSSGAAFVFSFSRRVESSGDTTQVFQYGSTLTGWTDIPVVPSPQVSIGTPSGGVELVTITIPKSGAKLFGRLKVSQP